MKLNIHEFSFEDKRYEQKENEEWNEIQSKIMKIKKCIYVGLYLFLVLNKVTVIDTLFTSRWWWTSVLHHGFQICARHLSYQRGGMVLLQGWGLVFWCESSRWSFLSFVLFQAIWSGSQCIQCDHANASWRVLSRQTRVQTFVFSIRYENKFYLR